MLPVVLPQPHILPPPSQKVLLSCALFCGPGADTPMVPARLGTPDANSAQEAGLGGSLQGLLELLEVPVQTQGDGNIHILQVLCWVLNLSVPPSGVLAAPQG